MRWTFSGTTKHEEATQKGSGMDGEVGTGHGYYIGSIGSLRLGVLPSEPLNLAISRRVFQTHHLALCRSPTYAP